MENTQVSDDHWDEQKSNYAQNLAAGVDLPGWAAKSFSPVELAVLGAIRDAAYKAPSGACSLTIGEIAHLAEVDLRTAIRAIAARNKGRPAFRVAVPEYYAASCLSCHGDPKGQISTPNV